MHAVTRPDRRPVEAWCLSTHATAKSLAGSPTTVQSANDRRLVWGHGSSTRWPSNSTATLWDILASPARGSRYAFPAPGRLALEEPIESCQQPAPHPVQNAVKPHCERVCGFRASHAGPASLGWRRHLLCFRHLPAPAKKGTDKAAPRNEAPPGLRSESDGHLVVRRRDAGRRPVGALSLVSLGPRAY